MGFRVLGLGALGCWGCKVWGIGVLSGLRVLVVSAVGFRVSGLSSRLWVLELSLRVQMTQ